MLFINKIKKIIKENDFIEYDNFIKVTINEKILANPTQHKIMIVQLKKMGCKLHEWHDVSNNKVYLIIR